MQKHYEALYGLLALLSIELANEEVVVDLIRLVLAVQVGSTYRPGSLGGALGLRRKLSSTCLTVVLEPGNFELSMGHSSMKTPNHGLVWGTPEIA